MVLDQDKEIREHKVGAPQWQNLAATTPAQNLHTLSYTKLTCTKGPPYLGSPCYKQSFAVCKQYIAGMNPAQITNFDISKEA